MRWILAVAVVMAVGTPCFAQADVAAERELQQAIAAQRANEVKELEARRAKELAVRSAVQSRRSGPRTPQGQPAVVPTSPLPASTTRPANPPSPEAIKSLVAQLSSDDWSARQKAQDKLVDFGEDALPDLKQYVADATDEEVRTRLEAAIRQIEASIKEGPTRITLHVKDVPVMDAMAEISKQAGVFIGFENQGAPNPMPTLTMDVDRQPLWLVLKDIAAKTGVGPVPYYSNNRRDIIALQQGSNFGQVPGFNSGCFYITANSASRSHGIEYASQNGSTSFYLQLAIWIDPKMKVLRSGYQLDMQEVTDEKGNSLMVPTNSGGGWASGQNYRRDVTVQLRYTPEIGKKIVKLKGSANFLIQTKSEKWEVPDILNAKDVSKVMSSGKYTIKEMKKTADGQYEINVIVEAAPNQPPQNGVIADYSMVQETMKLVDASGRTYWMGGGGGSSNAQRADYRYIFRRDMGGPIQPGDPVKLVWDVPVETKEIVVPVEMRDLELP